MHIKWTAAMALTGILFTQQSIAETTNTSNVAPGIPITIPITKNDNLVVTEQQMNEFSNMSYSGQKLFKKAAVTELRLENMSAVEPASSITVPSGFGASWGTIAMGAEYDSQTADNDIPSSSMSMDIGLGSADSIAADVTVSAADLGSNFANQGIIGTKLHHTFKSQLFAVGAGVTNYGGWGDSQHASYYLTMTKVFILRPESVLNDMPLTLTVGGGNNLYYDGDSNDLDENSSEYGAFGSIAWQALPRMSFIAEESGKVYSVGTSIVPVKTWPLALTVAAYDLSEHLPDHNVSAYIELGFVHQFA